MARWGCGPRADSGGVAPGPRLVPEIPAQGGGPRPRAALAASAPPGRRGRWRGGGGGWLAKEVLVVLVDFQLQAQVLVRRLGILVLTSVWRVHRGHFRCGAKGAQGAEEAPRRQGRRVRQQGPVPKRLDGEAQEQRPGCGRRG